MLKKINKMSKDNLNSRKNQIVLEGTINDSNCSNDSPFSQDQTSSSFKEYKKPVKTDISEFQDVVEPKPTFNIFPFGNKFINSYNNMNSQNFNNFFILFNINNNFHKDVNNFNFIGKKRKSEMEQLLKIKNFQNEENQSKYKTAFEKIDENNQNKKDLFRNKSAFIHKFSFSKVKTIKTNKIIKNLNNKIIINETNDSIKNSQKKNLFQSIRISNMNDSENNSNDGNIRKRRGRKPKNKSLNKKFHDKNDFDNILRKIQVHFLSFIIAFCNDLIAAFLPNNKELKFKNLDYKLKKTVKHSYVENLKTKKIGEILQFNVSSKIKKFNNSINQQIYQKVCELSPILNNFFNMSFVEFFNQYYYKSKPSFYVEGKIINLSERTKSFADLIEKNNIGAQKIQEIAIHNFMKSEFNSKPTIFVINKKNE